MSDKKSHTISHTSEAILYLKIIQFYLPYIIVFVPWHVTTTKHYYQVPTTKYLLLIFSTTNSKVVSKCIKVITIYTMIGITSSMTVRQ